MLEKHVLKTLVNAYKKTNICFSPPRSSKGMYSIDTLYIVCTNYEKISVNYENLVPKSTRGEAHHLCNTIPFNGFVQTCLYNRKHINNC